MSGSLVALAGALPAWMLGALPASYRGVPFYWATVTGTGGRRNVTHQFPMREDAYTEDLGRLPRHFRIKAFVIGEFYPELQAALISAVEDNNDAALLVHPTMGPVLCRAGLISWEETIEHGGAAFFDLEFVLDGPQPSPIGGLDPIAGLLAGVGVLLPLIADAFTALIPAILPPVDLLDSAAAAMAALPAATIVGLAPLIDAIAATPDDFVTTAAAVQAATASMVDNVIAAAAAQTLAADDPVAGIPFLLAPPTDLSGGLAGLATWGADLPASIGSGPLAEAAALQQAATVGLVQGSAAAALLQTYASLSWPTANAASAARDQALILLDAQAQAAAASGQDALYDAWLGLMPLTISMMVSAAQNLPSLVTYTAGDAFPSVTLAQRLYRDGGRGADLEQLNAVPDPLFMPPSGLALSP